MALNIKNERVHELVRELAARTGRSQTSVIEAALRHYLTELDSTRDAADNDDRLRDLLADVDLRRARGVQIPADAEFLYDERGLPT